MNIDRLIDMANDIGANLAAEPDRAEAVATMALHLRRFWEPRMRAQIIAHLAQGGAGLDPLPREAVAALADAG